MVDGRIIASPNARRVAAERGVSLATVRGTGPGGRIVSEDVEAAPVAPLASVAAAVLDANRQAVATVAARNLADLLGIDLALVPADPVERRITRDGVALYVRSRLADAVAATAASPAPALAPPPPPAAAPLLQEPTRTIRLSGMRGTIAKRMTASLREMAQLTLTMDADMDAVLADRAARRAAGGVTPSITDYVVAATARALVRAPRDERPGVPPTASPCCPRCTWASPSRSTAACWCRWSATRPTATSPTWPARPAGSPRPRRPAH